MLNKTLSLKVMLQDIVKKVKVDFFPKSLKHPGTKVLISAYSLSEKEEYFECVMPTKERYCPSYDK